MLTFEESGHVYRWHGERVVSVTQALRVLQNWDDVPAPVLEKKRLIGVALHKAIELEIQGVLDPLSIDPLVQPYYEAWQAFRDETRFAPVLTECRVTTVVSGMRYAGCVDAWGTMNGLPVIVDWKTSLVLDPAACGAQLAGYLVALTDMKIVGAQLSDRRIAVQFGSNGRYRLRRFTGFDSDWWRFTSQLRATLIAEKAA